MRKVEAYRSEDGRLYESASEANRADLEYFQLQQETKLIDLFGVEDAYNAIISVSDILDKKLRLYAILEADGREEAR